MAGRTYEKGIDVIKKAAEAKKSSRSFTPNIYWKVGDIHTVAFLTPMSETPKLMVHQAVRIPDDRFDSGFRYENIICKKDSSMLEESGGACELCDRVGHDPTERFIALAIELDPIKEGKKVKELKVKSNSVKRDDGSTVEYPRWGLIMQASGNFFAYFAAYEESQGDVREVAWEIHREGEGPKTAYHRYIVMNGPQAVALPDMSDILDDVPTLEEALEEMASDEKYAMVSELAPGSQPSFGNKSKPSTSSNGSSQSTPRQTDFDAIRNELLPKDQKDEGSLVESY